LEEACVNKLARSLQQYQREMRKPGRLHDEQGEALERIIWDRYPPNEEDRFENEMQAAVVKLTDFVEPHLKL
jgi:hypothetical protein